MRCDLLHDAGVLGVFGDDALDASGGEAAVLVFAGAIDIDEEERIEVLALVEIFFDPSLSFIGEEDDADFFAFAADAEFVFAEIDVFDVELGEFADTEASGEE